MCIYLKNVREHFPYMTINKQNTLYWHPYKGEFHYPMFKNEYWWWNPTRYGHGWYFPFYYH